MRKNRKKALLVLEDGKFFEGYSFGAEGEATGEVVFNTSMMGYQEILTDPSYKGQIVTMTYPLIGNYGANDEDFESTKPWVEGFVVREYSKIHSNWRAKKSLDEFLKKHNIVGIEEVDTRALTKHIRLQGAMKGIISTLSDDIKTLTEKAKRSPGVVGQDLVKDVSCKKRWWWKKEGRYKVIVVDCGVKFNILREISRFDCKVKVVPAKTSYQEILDLKPDGVIFSNGPGDPAAIPYVVETAKNLIGKVPLFGICLGHQVLGQALGGKTYKLKFGHHGGNHPVKDVKTGKVAITAQNHGFCVDIASLPDEVEITHINLYDNTLEGIRHKKLPLFSVQFHPEASPGPHDAAYLFEEFFELIKRGN
ncbi:MAG TPA: carbamoyl-phosphate synthase small subunit [Candidatus Aerophobetes bacterium]|uniref:Carbamoyl phosphate synthase small chain n=1 Tax=Aerophobetes bacterium TaxID=2030807 RepID=A0A7V5LZA1_UNCAE|nr:carbamoyl-phosphate synthase small subunit [Candidatus Aerophobetes bacterium]